MSRILAKLRQSIALSLFLCSFAYASTFSAVLKDGTGSTLKNAYVHFDLYNCGTNVPTITTGADVSIAKYSFDLKPNQPDGSIVGTVIGNDNITCGNVESTKWVVTVMLAENRPFSPPTRYVFCDAAIPPGESLCSNNTMGVAEFAALTPAGVPPSPGFNAILANPKGSQTLTEPAGSKINFVGEVNFCAATVDCGGSGGGGGGGITLINTTPPITGGPISSTGTIGISNATTSGPAIAITSSAIAAMRSGRCALNTTARRM